MRICKALLPIGLLLLLSACEPEPSLYPLYTEKDAVVEDALVGTWVTSEVTRGTVNAGLTFTFEKSGENAYQLTAPNDQGTDIRSRVHLVRLGKFSFLDLYPAELTPDEKKQNKAPEPFPQIGVHSFGRIWIEKDSVRIAMLDDEWFKKMAKEKKLTVSYESPDGTPILTAPTEVLQKFALQYAEDTKAFSFEVGLCRPGQARDCSFALLKQKLGINPNDAESWDSFGRAYSEMGRDDEALAAFNKAAQLDPSGGSDAHNYHHNIGRALLKKAQYEQARKEFLEAHD